MKHGKRTIELFIHKFNIIKIDYSLNLNGHTNVCNDFITMTKKHSSTVLATKRQQTYIL